MTLLVKLEKLKKENKVLTEELNILQDIMKKNLLEIRELLKKRCSCGNQLAKSNKRGVCIWCTVKERHLRRL